MHPWHDIALPDWESQAVAQIPVVIEVPKGGVNKYELDKATGLLRLDRVLSSAVHYPANYGFVPRTLGSDGDPLDVVVLSQEPIQPLTIVETRILGVLRMRDDGGIDDKLIGTARRDPAYSAVAALEDVPLLLLRQVRRFFQDYKALENKEVTVEEPLGLEGAMNVLRDAATAYLDARRS